MGYFLPILQPNLKLIMPLPSTFFVESPSHKWLGVLSSTTVIVVIVFLFRILKSDTNAATAITLFIQKQAP
jgi:hypothetical protein